MFSESYLIMDVLFSPKFLCFVTLLITVIIYNKILPLNYIYTLQINQSINNILIASSLKVVNPY